MGNVIYLTGAPATGKSTLGKYLQEIHDIDFISYSTELIEYVHQRGRSLELDDVKIREQSAIAITADDVENVDRLIIDRCTENRQNRNIIIDSHPVTKEGFGYRITGFSIKDLQELSPDFICCLYADPEVIEDRIKNNPGGRPMPTPFELGLHIGLQSNIAGTYGILVGCPVYILDCTKDTKELATFIISKCK